MGALVLRFPYAAQALIRSPFGKCDQDAVSKALAGELSMNISDLLINKRAEALNAPSRILFEDDPSKSGMRQRGFSMAPVQGRHAQVKKSKGERTGV